MTKPKLSLKSGPLAPLQGKQVQILARNQSVYSGTLRKTENGFLVLDNASVSTNHDACFQHSTIWIDRSHCAHIAEVQ